MRHAEVVALFDYHYWATRKVLEAATELTADEWTAPSSFTWRNIRGTLVHVLDVERSWRGRLRGDPQESWDNDLSEEQYPTARELAEHWARDEVEMRAWLEELEDRTLAQSVDLGGNDRFPLWYFLLHIITHSAQRRRDAVILLTNAGHTPPEIDFLDYGDSHGLRKEFSP